MLRWMWNNFFQGDYRLMSKRDIYCESYSFISNILLYKTFLSDSVTGISCFPKRSRVYLGRSLYGLQFQGVSSTTNLFDTFTPKCFGRLLPDTYNEKYRNGQQMYSFSQINIRIYMYGLEIKKMLVPKNIFVQKYLYIQISLNIYNVKIPKFKESLSEYIWGPKIYFVI